VEVLLCSTVPGKGCWSSKAGIPQLLKKFIALFCNNVKLGQKLTLQGINPGYSLDANPLALWCCIRYVTDANSGSVQELEWGRGAGCSFVQGNCNAYIKEKPLQPYFCPKENDKGTVCGRGCGVL
jgi:hypothetical protein